MEDSLPFGTDISETLHLPEPEMALYEEKFRSQEPGEFEFSSAEPVSNLHVVSICCGSLGFKLVVFLSMAFLYIFTSSPVRSLDVTNCA